MTEVQEKKVFKASPESKAKALKLRLFAMLAWIIAIAGEIFAIFKLINNDTLVWLLVAIGVILILAITGSILWKKANRLDPASEKDKFRFFIQNQLGAIMAVLAFLPLVILIFTDKDLSKKSKGIAGAVGIVALAIAAIVGIDFNPASIEKYTEQINAQTDTVKMINFGNDHVYWTPQGNKYHIYGDCQHITRSDISDGTVKQAWENKGISELCLTCKKRAIRDNLGAEKNIALPDVNTNDD